MMLFIPASLLKSLLYFTLCSSRASCLLRRVHVAFSHRFLGSDGSCCGPVPLGPHVSTVPPSLAWGSKLSVHSPWKVTVEAPLSSSLVTGRLLGYSSHSAHSCVSFAETHTIQWRSLSRAQTFLRCSLSLKITTK